MSVEVEVAGEMVVGLRCPNCGRDEVVAGIMLTLTDAKVAVPDVAQRCRHCGQIGSGP